MNLFQTARDRTRVRNVPSTRWEKVKTKPAYGKQGLSIDLPQTLPYNNR